MRLFSRNKKKDRCSNLESPGGCFPVWSFRLGRKRPKDDDLQSILSDHAVQSSGSQTVQTNHNARNTLESRDNGKQSASDELLCEQAPRSSAPTVTLWDQAYSALEAKDPKLVKNFERLLLEKASGTQETDRNDAASTPLPRDRRQEIAELAQKGVELVERTKPKMTINNRQIDLLDSLATVAAVADYSKGFVGEALKPSPPASLAWAAVCLTLPLLTNPPKAKAAREAGFEKVTWLMHLHLTLEPTSLDPELYSKLPDQTIDLVKERIVSLYQAILEFQLKTVARLYKSRFAAYFREVAYVDDWGGMLEIACKAEEEMQSVLTLLRQEDTRKNVGTIAKSMETTSRLLEDVGTDVRHMGGRLIELNEQAQKARMSDEDIRIRDGFYLGDRETGDSYDSHRARLEKRVQGTCESFLNDRKFTSWQRQTSGVILVTAGPGRGKSVLANYLVDNVLPEQGVICYFFFQKGAGQTSMHQALCAMIYQLFGKRPHLIHHAAKHSQPNGKGAALQDWMLWEILEGAIHDPEAGQVIMVVDALDECDESECPDFLSRLRSLSGGYRQDGSPNECKCLVTGRPFARIADPFEHEHVLQLEPTGEEIAMVIRHRVRILGQKGRLSLSKEVEEYLVEQLLAKNSQRNYLWAHLMMKLFEGRATDTSFWFLRGGKTKGAIDKVVAELPDSVNDAYEQILARIYSKLEDSRNLVRKVLSIVLAAERPLNTAEMLVAVQVDSVSSGSKEELDGMLGNGEEAFKSTLQQLTGFFVDVDGDVVSFIHLTCREFLLENPESISEGAAAPVSSTEFKWKNSIPMGQAQGLLAMQCLLCISLFQTAAQPARLLLTYSPSPEQAKLNEPDEPGEFKTATQPARLLLTYTPSSGPAKLNEPDELNEPHEPHEPDEPDEPHEPDEPGKPGESDEPEDALPAPFTKFGTYSARYWPAHYAAATVDSKGSSLGPRVSEICDLGSTAYKAWEKLCATGKLVPPLHQASQGGHTEVMRLLLENGADSDHKDDRLKQTPLIHASIGGHVAAVQLLLEHGANMAITDRWGRTALLWAVTARRDDILNAQLAKVASLKGPARGNILNPVLFRVAGQGRTHVLNWLLKAGAKLDVQDQLGYTILHQAAAQGQHVMVEYLLGLKFDKDAKDIHGNTPLLLAATSGQLEVVKRLADASNIDSKNDFGDTALSLAAANDMHSVVKFLLVQFESLTDPDSENLNGETPLLLAAANGCFEAVRFLLGHSKANINARDSNGNTPLARAAQHGHCHVVSLLLEREDVLLESRNNHGMTPLALAAHFDQEAVLTLLLNRGANMETRNDDGETPLATAAAKSGIPKRVEMLLDKGAKPHAVVTLGMPILLVAIQNGQDDAVRILLEGAAKINPSKPLPTGIGGRALRHAVVRDRLQIVAQLLDHGVPVDARDDTDNTALSTAAMGGNHDIAWFLLIRGADVNAKDRKGQTAAMLAEEFKRTGVIEVLNMNHSADQFRNKFKKVGDYYEVTY